MERIIFIMDENGKAQRVARTPEWATHVIKRKSDQVLFFACNYTGENEFYTGPGPVSEFHPDGYDVYDVIIKTARPAPIKKEDDPKPQPGPKFYQTPAYKVGDEWLVGLPGRQDLVSARIEKVGILTLTLSYKQGALSVQNSFGFGDLRMVEPLEWTDTTTAQAPINTPKADLAVGQKWWVENGNRGDLIKVQITYLTENVITVEGCVDNPKPKTVRRERITFVERAQD